MHIAQLTADFTVTTSANLPCTCGYEVTGSVQGVKCGRGDLILLLSTAIGAPKMFLTFSVFEFQVFVANPNKPKPILDILLRNQEKLVDFLTRFHTDRSEDEQFNDEKAYLIKQIKELKPLTEH
jgi:hypothetical protein